MLSELLDLSSAEVMPPDDLWLAEKAERIRLRGQRIVSDITAIGMELIEVRSSEYLPRGGWADWLEREFQWSEDTALRFVRVAEAFQNRAVRIDLPIDTNALYLITGTRVPAAVRNAVVERAEAGERITKAEAERMVSEARDQATAAAADRTAKAIRAAVQDTRRELENRIAELQAAPAPAEKNTAATNALRQQIEALKAELAAPPDIASIIARICSMLGVTALSDDQLRRLASALDLAIEVKRGRATKRFEPVTPEESAAIQQRLIVAGRIADALAVLEGAPTGADMPGIAFAVHRNAARRLLPGLIAWAQDYLALLGPDMEDPRND